MTIGVEVFPVGQRHKQVSGIERDAVQNSACSVCVSPKGLKCKRPGGRFLTRPHKARVEAYRITRQLTVGRRNKHV